MVFVDLTLTFDFVLTLFVFSTSNLDNIVVVLIWFRMILTQLLTHVCKDLFRLDIPMKYQYLIVICNFDIHM